MCMSKEILKYFKDITQKHHKIKTDFEDSVVNMCVCPCPCACCLFINTSRHLLLNFNFTRFSTPILCTAPPPVACNIHFNPPPQRENLRSRDSTDKVNCHLPNWSHLVVSVVHSVNEVFTFFMRDWGYGSMWRFITSLINIWNIFPHITIINTIGNQITCVWRYQDASVVGC